MEIAVIDVECHKDVKSIKNKLNILKYLTFNLVTCNQKMKGALVIAMVAYVQQNFKTTRGFPSTINFFNFSIKHLK